MSPDPIPAQDKDAVAVNLFATSFPRPRSMAQSTRGLLTKGYGWKSSVVLYSAFHTV